jgi:AcrR family transcriptional regulator
MPTTLKERKVALTREAIFDALATIIAEGGIAAFSVQAVADAAGVSHRTVYRHFPTRESLLEGLGTWLNARFAERLGIELDGYPDLAPNTLGEVAELGYQIFHDSAAWMAAYVMLIVGAGIRLPSRVERSVWFRRLLTSTTTHLPKEDAVAAAEVIRMLASSITWHQIREHGFATPDGSARAVRWAIETLVADLQKGGGPQGACDEAR